MAIKDTQAFSWLQKAYAENRLAHALLILGAKSTQKTFASKLIALLQESEIEQNRPLQDWVKEGVLLLEPQSKSRRIRVDEVREVESSLFKTAQSNKWKILVILEADRLAIEAQNAFLKTLEEPPADTLILLLTSHPDQLLTTIRSRCLNIELEPEENTQLEANTQQLYQILSEYDLEFSDISALGLKAQFAELLRQIKEQEEEQIQEIWKSEKTKYAKSADSTWLSQRENYYKSLTQANYWQARKNLIEALIFWLAEVIKKQAGATTTHLMEYQATLEQWKQRFPAQSQQCLQALEDMQQDLESNVSEALALEIGFLQAFA